MADTREVETPRKFSVPHHAPVGAPTEDVRGSGVHASNMRAYDESHRHPVNRALHIIGIPLIVCAGAATLSPWRPFAWSRWETAAGFGAGWALLFIGHRIEGNRPLVLSDPSAVITAPIWLVRRALSRIQRGR